VWEKYEGKNYEEIVKDYFDNMVKSTSLIVNLCYQKKKPMVRLFLVQQKDNFHFVIYDNLKKESFSGHPAKIMYLTAKSRRFFLLG